MKKDCQVKISPDNAATLMLFAFRYVLGRASYAPSLWVDLYHDIFPQLSEDQQKFLKDRLISELEQAFQLAEIRSSTVGMDCDDKMWHRFYEELTHEENV